MPDHTRMEAGGRLCVVTESVISHRLHSRRIALLEMEDAEKWAGCSEVVWRDALEQDGDVWELFQCHAHQYPSPASVSAYDFLILTGSHYSAYEDIPWIRELEALLPLYVQAGVRILACCFGHQLLAKALGGTVTSNPSGRFVLTVEDIKINTAAFEATGLSIPLAKVLSEGQCSAAVHNQHQHSSTGDATADVFSTGSRSTTTTTTTQSAASTVSSCEVQQGVTSISLESDPPTAGISGGERASSCASPKEPGSAGVSDVGGRPPALISTGQQLRLLESHGDQVTMLPRGAQLLASSATAKHELWSLGENVLAFQFHPEMSRQVAYAKIWTADAIQKKMAPTELAASESSLLHSADDSHIFLHLLHHFVTHGLKTTHSCLPCSSTSTLTSPAAAAQLPPLDACTAVVTAAGAGSAQDRGGSSGPGEIGFELGIMKNSQDGATRCSARHEEVLHTEGQAVNLQLQHQQQQQQQQTSELDGARERRFNELGGATGKLVDAVKDAFDAGLESCSLEYRLLNDMNKTTTAKYSEMADVAAGVAAFATRLSIQAPPVQAAIDDLEEMEARLDGLMGIVDDLDSASLRLAEDVGGGASCGVLAGLAGMWGGSTGRK